MQMLDKRLTGRTAKGKRTFTIFVLGFAGLYLTSRYSFLLFHTFAELFGVGVALGIFFVAWNSKERLDTHYFLFLGVLHLYVAVILLLHTLAYKGMSIFPGYGANLPTQLWILGGYFQCAAFLGAPGFLNREANPEKLLAFGFLCTAISLFLIFGGLFPACFVEGRGLTPFKKISEVAICICFAASLAFLWRNRDVFDRFVLVHLSIGLLFNIFSRTAFIFYVDVYGLSNLAGHFLYLGYAFQLYRVVVETGISRPHRLMFRRLVLQKEALEKLSGQLEHKVRERTRELEDVARVASHDLRESLRGLNHYAQFLLEDYGGRLDAEGRKMLETLVRLAARQETMIGGIRQFLQVGEHPLTPAETDADRLARRAASALETAWPGANIRVRSPLPAVRGDPELLSIVFRNVMENGLKFNESPSKRLEIGALPRQKGKGIVFFVRDDGIGIPERHRERIFSIFKRLHVQGRFGGAGVGLAVAKKILDRHQGRIWLESEPGRGTTFYFELPASGEGAQNGG
jgi:signal transduction histidine kinase